MIDGFLVPSWTQVNVCCRLVAPGEVSCIKVNFALSALNDLRLSCAFFDTVRPVQSRFQFIIWFTNSLQNCKNGKMALGAPESRRRVGCFSDPQSRSEKLGAMPYHSILVLVNNHHKVESSATSLRTMFDPCSGFFFALSFF
jgi:hypothetical protein